MVMKVHLIKELTILDYISKQPHSATYFKQWLIALSKVRWRIPSDIVDSFNHADILGKGSNRVVFNVGGNKYRIICSYFIGSKRFHLFINWIGTHSEYDILCKNGNQYTVKVY